MPSNNDFSVSVCIDNKPVPEYTKDGHCFIKCDLSHEMTYLENVTSLVDGEKEQQKIPVTPYSIRVKAKSLQHYYKVKVDGEEVAAFNIIPGKTRTINGFKDGRCIRQFLFSLPRYAEDKDDRVSIWRTESIGKIEVECWNAYTDGHHWVNFKKKPSGLRYVQANKKDSSKATQGKYIMATTKVGRVIHERQQDDCPGMWFPTWKRDSLRSTLTIHYHMPHTLQAMGLLPQAEECKEKLPKESHEEVPRRTVQEDTLEEKTECAASTSIPSDSRNADDLSTPNIKQRLRKQVAGVQVKDSPALGGYGDTSSGGRNRDDLSTPNIKQRLRRPVAGVQVKDSPALGGYGDTSSGGRNRDDLSTPNIKQRLRKQVAGVQVKDSPASGGDGDTSSGGRNVDSQHDSLSTPHVKQSVCEQIAGDQVKDSPALGGYGDTSSGGRDVDSLSTPQMEQRVCEQIAGVQVKDSPALGGDGDTSSVDRNVDSLSTPQMEQRVSEQISKVHVKDSPASGGEGDSSSGDRNVDSLSTPQMEQRVREQITKVQVKDSPALGGEGDTSSGDRNVDSLSTPQMEQRVREQITKVQVKDSPALGGEGDSSSGDRNVDSLSTPRMEQRVCEQITKVQVKDSPALGGYGDTSSGGINVDSLSTPHVKQSVCEQTAGVQVKDSMQSSVAPDSSNSDMNNNSLNTIKADPYSGQVSQIIASSQNSGTALGDTISPKDESKDVKAEDLKVFVPRAGVVDLTIVKEMWIDLDETGSDVEFLLEEGRPDKRKHHNTGILEMETGKRKKMDVVDLTLYSDRHLD